ncbi:MAG TPA: glycosyltransferase [Chloroflexi bacterium]|nr:glycosyltransferase [Chloroflexota bacterium]
MRIAVFTPYLPYPPDTGGKIRSYYLLRALTERFDVDLYSVFYKPPSPENVNALQRACRRVTLFRLKKTWRTRDRVRRALAPLPRLVDYFHTAESLAQARQHLRDTAYDLIVADEICMTPYAELAPEIPRIVIRHKVDHVHYWEVATAQPWGLEKLLGLVEAKKLHRYERKKMPFFQAYVACSEQDASIIDRDAPGIPHLVIPNGADLSKFTPSGRKRAGDPTLLYVGSMNYYPNIDAMLYFFHEMYPSIREAVPNVRVWIVGHAPPPKILELGNLPGVTVTGTVPDPWPYYDQADVFIVPLRLGGGTRLKIIEAMAMGLPVVSTTVGAEGVEIRPGQNILIADDPESFVAAVLRLLTDRHLAKRIAEEGRRLAERYDWSELTRPYADLAEQVVEEWKEKREQCESSVS